MININKKKGLEKYLIVYKIQFFEQNLNNSRPIVKDFPSMIEKGCWKLQNESNI